MNDKILVDKDFLRVLSKSKIIQSIDELHDIFMEASRIIDLDRVILYKQVSKTEVKVIFIYTALENDISRGDKICIKNNINIQSAIETNNVSKIPVPDIGEDLVYPIGKNFFLAIDDISEARRLNEINEFLIETLALSINTSIKMMKLVEDNTQDALTQLFNRGVLNRLIDFNETPYGQASEKIKAIGFIDIDHFGLFNKKYGHSVGDVVLKGVAQAIKNTLKKKGGETYRYGGEEFVVVFFKEQDYVQVIEELREHIQSTPIYYENNKYNITISSGLSINQNNEDNVSIIKKSNHALLRAKETGQNKLVCYNSMSC